MSDDKVLITLRINRHQLKYRDDGTLYGLMDWGASQISIGDEGYTEVVSIEDCR